MGKPLRDVSNFKTAMKSANVAKVVSNDDGEQAGDYSLDRLLLVQSDLSSLLRQVMHYKLWKPHEQNVIYENF